MQPTDLVLWPLGCITQPISIRCAAAKFKGMVVYSVTVTIGVKSQVRSADYHEYFLILDGQNNFVPQCYEIIVV